MMDSRLLLNSIIDDLKKSHVLDPNEHENDWQSLMQYFITSEFIYQSYDNAWDYIDNVIQYHLDKLGKEQQLELTIEAFENDTQARNIGEDHGIINDDSEYDEVETACEEVNFTYIKNMLHNEADSASQDYAEELEKDYLGEDDTLENENYVKTKVVGFLQELIQHFDAYNLNDDTLVLVTQLYVAIKKGQHFVEKEQLLLRTEKIIDESNYKIFTIILDEDGLKLESNGKRYNRYGLISFSTITHPIEEYWEQDDFEDNVTGFIEEFGEALKGNRPDSH